MPGLVEIVVGGAIFRGLVCQVVEALEHLGQAWHHGEHHDEAHELAEESHSRVLAWSAAPVLGCDNL